MSTGMSGYVESVSLDRMKLTPKASSFLLVNAGISPMSRVILNAIVAP
jgi:hypothetical protein